MKKIEAAARLSAVRIVPQTNAYSDAAGHKALNRFTVSEIKKLSVLVPTNDPEITIAVRKSYHTYSLYLIHRELVIGHLYLISCFRGKLFEPSSYFRQAYRGKGYALMLYKWVLDNGFTLVTSNRQSKFSNGLWKRLAQDYPILAFGPDNIYTGVSAIEKFDHPYFRSVLVDRGQSVSKVISIIEKESTL